MGMNEAKGSEGVSKMIQFLIGEKMKGEIEKGLKLGLKNKARHISIVLDYLLKLRENNKKQSVKRKIIKNKNFISVELIREEISSVQSAKLGCLLLHCLFYGLNKGNLNLIMSQEKSESKKTHKEEKYLMNLVIKLLSENDSFTNCEYLRFVLHLCKLDYYCREFKQKRLIFLGNNIITKGDIKNISNIFLEIKETLLKINSDSYRCGIKLELESKGLGIVLINFDFVIDKFVETVFDNHDVLETALAYHVIEILCY